MPSHRQIASYIPEGYGKTKLSGERCVRLGGELCHEKKKTLSFRYTGSRLQNLGKPQIILRDLNLGFQGLALVGQICNPVVG